MQHQENHGISALVFQDLLFRLMETIIPDLQQRYQEPGYPLIKAYYLITIHYFNILCFILIQKRNKGQQHDPQSTHLCFTEFTNLPPARLWCVCLCIIIEILAWSLEVWILLGRTCSFFSSPSSLFSLPCLPRTQRRPQVQEPPSPFSQEASQSP